MTGPPITELPIVDPPKTDCPPTYPKPGVTTCGKTGPITPGVITVPEQLVVPHPLPPPNPPTPPKPPSPPKPPPTPHPSVGVVHAPTPHLLSKHLFPKTVAASRAARINFIESKQISKDGSGFQCIFRIFYFQKKEQQILTISKQMFQCDQCKRYEMEAVQQSMTNRWKHRKGKAESQLIVADIDYSIGQYQVQTNRQQLSVELKTLLQSEAPRFLITRPHISLFPGSSRLASLALQDLEGPCYCNSWRLGYWSFCESQALLNILKNPVTLYIPSFYFILCPFPLDSLYLIFSLLLVKGNTPIPLFGVTRNLDLFEFENRRVFSLEQYQLGLLGPIRSCTSQKYQLYIPFDKIAQKREINTKDGICQRMRGALSTLLFVEPVFDCVRKIFLIIDLKNIIRNPFYPQMGLSPSLNHPQEALSVIST